VPQPLMCSLFVLSAAVIRRFSSIRQSGFTLVELIVVMIVVGILAVAALPRLLQNQTFETRAFYDRALSMVRYGQKVAIAQRTNVFVNVNAGSRTVCLTYVADATCTAATGVIDPATAAKFSLIAPAGVSVSGTPSFSFSALGRPDLTGSPAASLAVTGDGATRTILVEQETGYVR
jgi:MSHA pilin protein MshC